MDDDVPEPGDREHRHAERHRRDDHPSNHGQEDSRVLGAQTEDTEALLAQATPQEIAQVGDESTKRQK